MSSTYYDWPMSPSPVLRIFIWTLVLLGCPSSLATNFNCKCFPGDPCWPSSQVWLAFNQTVGGRLIQTIPLAASCHDPHYDGAQCSYLKSQWLLPEVHYNSSSSIMSPFFINNSCTPFTSEQSPCLLGNYVDYAVDVTNSEHVAQTIQFAVKHNIRLVIKNTGHDYNGKSTGAGAISIWTHHLKNISFEDYHDAHYTGKAIKMGAGIQGIEAYEAAHEKGLALVGGECPTVGIAGGYAQGGGHSALASKFGLGADQTLEWEVVTGDGRLLKANRETNSDLYWALSGGGGSTYGVVWSLTYKAYPDFVTGAANLTFSNANISQDTFYDAVGEYQALNPKIVDAGAMSVWILTNTSFTLTQLTAPNMTTAEVTSLLKPFTDKLAHLHIKYDMVVKEFPNYLDSYNAMQAPLFAVQAVGIAQYGGWLIPRSVVEHNNAGLTAAIRNITSYNTQFVGVGLNVSKAVAGNVSNAVLPAWREALIDCVITTPWNFTAPLEQMLANQRAMTDIYIPQLKNLAPHSGCYLNEGNFLQPDWQSAFYGANYAALRKIKAKYDPEDIFYATTAVGADEWSVEQSGRLCKI